jgi:hypothetical protein
LIDEPRLRLELRHSRKLRKKPPPVFSLDDICRAADYTVIDRKWYYAPSPDQ